MRSARRGTAVGILASTALLTSVAVCTTTLLYRNTLRYGFDYDDYHFMRPHSLGDVRRAFFDTWDPAGIMVPFYRPLTVAFHALRFELFGLNSVAHHAVSLGLFALAAALAGWIATRLAGRRLAGFLAVLLFVCHPAMPYALAAWVTNQMHLIEVVTVFSALVWWDIVRARTATWWLPLLIAATAAFLIKEDGVMLVPAIVVLHWLRRRLAEPQLPRVPIAFLSLSLLLLVSLILIRGAALEGLGGYGRPTMSGAWRNFVNGPNGVFRLVPADRPWQLHASTFATVLPLMGLALWPRASRGARLLLLSGVATALLFNLPAAFASKAEQMHFVAFGAVITLTGASLTLFDALPGRAGAFVSGTVIAAGIMTFGLVAADISRDFAPFGPMVASHDRIVEGWAAVPHQVRAYLARKRDPGAAASMSANPVDELDCVVFGAHGPEAGRDGVAYQWMSGPRTEIHVTRHWQAVDLPLRHAIDAFREPATAHIAVDGRPVDRVTLDTADWRVSTIALQPLPAPRWRRMRRVVIEIDHAWRPSEIIPRSSDSRVLGLQVGMPRGR